MFHSVMTAPSGVAPVFSPLLADPLDADSVSDVPIVVTKRRLTRLALIASEVGARFEREGQDVDPMAWMLAPRELFDGAAALDACLERDDCMRALLLHGLGIGLDASPDSLDALLDCSEDEEAVPACDGGLQFEKLPRRLYTATLVEDSGSGARYAFAAIMAASEEVARRELGYRLDPVRPSELEVVPGFDISRPVVTALLSEVVADMLSQVAADPGSPLADGLEVVVEQRFAA